MTYATLMVHLHTGQSNTNVLKITDDLAVRLNAGVIGIAACRPMDFIYSDGYVPAETIQQDLDQLAADINVAEAEFRSSISRRVPFVGWRSSISYRPLADLVAAEARSADLLLTAVASEATVFTSSRWAEPGDLIMQAGRPVLVVPETAGPLSLEHVVVGWKDTGEARAVADALPLLRMAAHVEIVAIAPEDELDATQSRLDDVAAWLSRHGICAKTIAAPSAGDDTRGFEAIAQERKADLIVAGAYGHTRVREWAFGGFTRDLLLRGKRCAFVSH